MKFKLSFFSIFVLVMAFLTVLSLWNALGNARIALSMRQIKAKIAASALKVDWGRPDSESVPQPLYTLMMDLQATDSSNRTFHWEGDPGQAVYPEEALDTLSDWSAGREITVSILRGNAREIRMDQLEANPEIGKAIGWTVLAVMLGLTAFAGLVAGNEGGGRGASKLFKGLGTWTVFFGFGLLPLLGSIPICWASGQRIFSWKPVAARMVGESAPFDTSKPFPNVQFTAAAVKELAESSYERFEFDWNGRKIHGGYGSWQGVYDLALPGKPSNFFVNPKDRWEVAPALSWKEDFALPVGIMLFLASPSVALAF